MSQIKVLITDDTGYSTSQTNGNNALSSGSNVNSPINDKGKISDAGVDWSDGQSKKLAVASMVASQTFNYGTSNIGKWTGATRKQTQFDNAKQMISIGAMAYVSPLVAIANVGINLATTAMDTVWEEKWDRYAKDNARARAGELKGRGR